MWNASVTKQPKLLRCKAAIKMLEKFAAVTLEAKSKSVTMKFPEGKKSAKEVVKAIDLGHNYGSLNVFGDLNFTLFRGDKVAFVGVNGSGKSTLSRLLSLSEQPSSGSVKYGDGVNMAFFSQESSENLNYKKTIWEEVNTVATKANDQEKRNLLGAFLFSGDDIYKPVSVLSGGEKSRLSLLKIMLLDTNFLILDEPTNHLDLKTKDIFQEALINYHGTVAIVSHDRYFLDRLVNKIFELKDGSINYYFGNYSYFIEKRSQTTIELKNDSLLKVADKEQAFKNKEKKRLEAEERNKIFKIKSFWKKDLASIEEKIQALEARKAEHESVLCDPQTHKDSSKIKKLNIELKDITSELEHSYSIWTELNYKLEKLAAGNSDNAIMSEK